MALNDLVVNVSANTKDLAKGLRKGVGEQRKFGRQSERLGRTQARRNAVFARRTAKAGAGIGKIAGGLGLGALLLRGGALAGGGAAVAAAGPAITSRARAIRQAAPLAQVFKTSGQIAGDEFVTELSRTMVAGIKSLGRGAGRRFGPRAQELTEGFLRLVTRGDLGGINQMFGGVVAGRGGAGNLAGARGRAAKKFAEQSRLNRLRVSGAVARGTQAEAGALSRIIGGQGNAGTLRRRAFETLIRNFNVQQQKVLGELR